MLCSRALPSLWTNKPPLCSFALQPVQLLPGFSVTSAEKLLVKPSTHAGSLPGPFLQVSLKAPPTSVLAGHSPCDITHIRMLLESLLPGPSALSAPLLQLPTHLTSLWGGPKPHLAPTKPLTEDCTLPPKPGSPGTPRPVMALPSTRVSEPEPWGRRLTLPSPLPLSPVHQSCGGHSRRGSTDAVSHLVEAEREPGLEALGGCKGGRARGIECAREV